MIWSQYVAKPSRTAPRVVMLPTNFPVGSEPPAPVDALLEAPGPAPPSFGPPVLELELVFVLVLEFAPVLEFALVLALVLPAPPEPPPPSPPPSPPSEQPKSAAIPSASQAVLQSHREERFWFMSKFPFCAQRG
ncbi:hypothetical protein [Sorangium sp. So ce1078]|uniref:hypothetical protein n=1 Tax=Sorangium sp. So ce1078 TaxID=3133329 RepID=UPI003F6000DB